VTPTDTRSSLGQHRVPLPRPPLAPPPPAPPPPAPCSGAHPRGRYLPELSPCTALRSLSLANVRILADSGYSRWEVEVAGSSAPGSTLALANYVSRGHKLAPLFGLIFRRSSVQHPLLAGALGESAAAGWLSHAGVRAGLLG
jgi:hypothetical protein